MPALEKLIVQLAVRFEDRVAEQDSPVLAFTVTEPVGPAPVPEAAEPTATAWRRVEGLGELDVIAIELETFSAAVLWVAVALEYFPKAGHEAAVVHVPVPLVMVTIACALAAVPVTRPTEQIPLVPLILGNTPALVVAVTVNVLLYEALYGAPLNVMVGGIGLTVKVAEPMFVPDAAEIVTVPGLTPDASPVALTVATAGFEEVQVTNVPALPLLPSVYVPLAVNCALDPAKTLADEGVTESEARTA